MELEGAKSFGKAVSLDHPGSLESTHDEDRTRFGTLRSLDKEIHHTVYSVPMHEVYIREHIKRAQGDLGYFIPSHCLANFVDTHEGCVGSYTSVNYLLI